MIHQLAGERLVAEHLLDAGLAVVEVAAHAPDGHVGAGGGDHLLALDVAHAAIGVQHAHAHMVDVLEALERGLARIAGRRDEDHEVVVDPAFVMLLFDACREEARQALQRHVLERAGGAVPQLEHVRVGVERGDRADLGRVEVVAVDLFHEAVDNIVGKVDLERAVHVRGALGVGHPRQRQDLVHRHLGDGLGNVQSSARREAVDHGFGECGGLGRLAPRVDIQIGGHPCSRRPMFIIHQQYTGVRMCDKREYSR